MTTEDAARLTVTDDGTGAEADTATDPGATPAGGTGLRGLAERLAAAGGTLRAGEGAGGGFQVTVDLPVVHAEPGAGVSSAAVEPSASAV